MRVMVIGGYAPSLLNFRGHLVASMVEAGHIVTACAPGLTPQIRGALENLGVSSHEIPLDRTGTSVFADMRSVRYLRKLFQKAQPDLVLSYTVKPVIYGSLAARSVGVPKVASIITGLGYTFGNSSIKQRMIGSVTRQLYKYAMRANTVVFFQNPDDMRLFIEQRLIDDAKKAVLINGSGVDLRYYKQVPVVTDPPTFLLIGRLIRDKGIFEYVEAARKVRSKYPNVRFHLVGPFDTNPSAISRSTIEKWQSEGIVDYFGEASDVRPYIAGASVYVLPSYREGTPRTVLEAMAMGRPIITTDAPGCRETVVDGRNGFLVPVGDVHSLVEAMEQFILRPQLIEEMGAESVRIAREKYDVHKVNEVILRSLQL